MGWHFEPTELVPGTVVFEYSYIYRGGDEIRHRLVILPGEHDHFTKCFMRSPGADEDAEWWPETLTHAHEKRVLLLLAEHVAGKRPATSSQTDGVTIINLGIIPVP